MKTTYFANFYDSDDAWQDSVECGATLENAVDHAKAEVARRYARAEITQQTVVAVVTRKVVTKRTR